jgi:hypothetical protein
MANEQMYLCTLLPFHEEDDFEGHLEASIQTNWRNNEIKFVSALGTYILPIGNMRTSEWLNLCTAPYCKLVALLRPSDFAPLGIRVILNRESIVNAYDSLNTLRPEDKDAFFNFEASLQICCGQLNSTYYLENLDKKRRSQAWDNQTRRHIDIQMSLKLSENLYWSFTTNSFSRECPENLVLHEARPTVLVSNCCDSWRSTVLERASQTHKTSKSPAASATAATECISVHGITLVVTNEPSKWLKTWKEDETEKAVEFETRGLPMCDIDYANMHGHTLVISPNGLQSNIHSLYNLYETVEYCMKSASGQSKRTKGQVKRTIVESLVKKLPNFVVPSTLLQVGCIVIDDFETNAYIKDLLGSLAALRWIQVCKSDLTKPKKLSFYQQALCYPGHAYAKAHIQRAIEASLLVVQVPKNILRKIRILGHLVKNGPIEERIGRMFLKSVCPVGMNDSLQRFSGKSMPKATAKGLIERHFGRTLVSLATFSEPSQPNESAISSKFVLQSLDEHKTCAVCFDAIDDTVFTYTYTICGHVYCKDCVKQLFYTEWNQGKSKECGQCRHLLSLGDAFAIQPDDKPFVPSVSAMESAMSNFLTGLRTSTQSWDPAVDYDLNVKNVVSNQLWKINASMLLKKFSAHHSINVHVFYTPDEAAEFAELQNAFVK